MKKILGLFFVAITAVALVACGKKEYGVDGTFTAFEVGVNSGAAQVTWVDVTIQKGKVAKYFIDARQGKIVEGKQVWNAETKKELQYGYRMHGQNDLSVEDYKKYLADNNLKEWFEQAELLEKEFLAKGVENVNVKDNYFENVTGVTIKDGSYTKLAKAALENAKKGVTIAFEVGVNSGAAQVTWVDVTIEKGKVAKYFIDARQGKIVEGKQVWNAETKKELQYGYRMHGQNDLSVEDYKKYLADNNLKEWFEQAELLEKEFLAKGVENVNVKDNYFENVTGVTIKDGSYTKLAKAALAKVGK
ncbi:LptM family lipoprotein [Haploplasma axanthum]|uniref:Major membrane immunogen, membrane-anchored lipoprotein n=1 Tax=Haploplasma axanthum TaxID=29552 RepID=A0A449BEC2_HAPAX|nr:hypothetical protein [Haploplasma axanthum]VEU80776.1 Uncharacterised protein [Haploplasma axanthum]